MAIDLDASPPPELRFRRRTRLGPSLKEVWGARELVRSLAEREFRVRYKQTLLGLGWAVLTPLALMVVFSLFFNRVAHIDTGDIPYPLFAYMGLLPWAFFSTSVSQGGLSLVSNNSLLNKVYCPREVFPLGSVCVALLDMAVASTVLVVLFAVFGRAPQATSVLVPLLLYVQLAFTIGVALVASIVIVYLRDVRQALPILLQLALFATPVAYGLDAIPRAARPFYVAANPLALVIDGYRRTVLYGDAPSWGLFAVAAVSATAIMVGGFVIFKRMETGIADVA